MVVETAGNPAVPTTFGGRPSAYLSTLAMPSPAGLALGPQMFGLFNSAAVNCWLCHPAKDVVVVPVLAALTVTGVEPVTPPTTADTVKGPPAAVALNTPVLLIAPPPLTAQELATARPPSSLASNA